jgi:HD domain-containing protein
MEASRDQVAAQLAEIDRSFGSKLAELDDIIRFILAANEPTVLDQGGLERIAEIAGMSWKDDDGSVIPYLTYNEASCLQIRRGSLTEQERLEINSHVVHSYNFLRRIPWSRTLRDVPEIASSHHEKLDGTGYPNALRGDQIPMPARMMAISDIYDALTASDRPYKKAIPTEKALDILSTDVKRGQLDADLFDVFVAARVWTRPLRNS